MSFMLDTEEVYKAISILAVEKTLLDIGKPVYEKVVGTLNKKYHCYLPDCYEHPEYLAEILQTLFGNGHHAVITTINKQLEEWSSKKHVAEFLKVINK